MRFTEVRADDPSAVDAAADHLEMGGLLAHPTGGVYGLGGAAGTTDAEVARLKDRTPDAGFVYLVADVAALRTAFPSVRWTALCERLAGTLWPGPLTLVLDDGTDRGVAVRVEPHPFTRDVLGRYGGAMSSSSLNRSGEPPATGPAGARTVLGAMPPSERSVLFVDAGELPGPPPSTLVRVPGRGGRGREAWELLREGAIAASRVATVVEEAAVDGRVPDHESEEEGPRP